VFKVSYSNAATSQKNTKLSLWLYTAQHQMHSCQMHQSTRMWANAQPDGRPAEHRWRPLFNAAKFG